MEPSLKSQTILDFIQKEEKEGTKRPELLKLLEDRIKDLVEISNDQDFENYGDLFRKWLEITNELGHEGGQNQERCSLFSPMIEYVIKHKSSKDKINVIHLTQYQAEKAVERWFRKTIFELAAEIKKSTEVTIVVGKGLKSGPEGPKLPNSIRALFKEFGIFALYSDGRVRALLKESEFARFMKYFNLEKNLETIRSDPETKKEIPRLINGHGHVISLWNTKDVTESTVLEQVVNLTSTRIFQTISKPTEDSAAALIFAAMEELIKQKPKNLNELLAAVPTQNRLVIYTFSPVSTKIGLKEDSFMEIAKWGEVSLVEDFLKKENTTQKYVILRADENEETTKTGIAPFGERLRTAVDELDTIKTTKTIMLIVHVNFESKKAAHFIRYKAGWNQYMIDELF